MSGLLTNSIRVVVVDDSPLMRSLVAKGLARDGDIDVVATCANSQEARSAIKELDPDLVTLDVEMPGMNGIEFLSKIMELRPMPVVMVSTRTQKGTETSIEALEIGAADVISKPSGKQDIDRFHDNLRNVVRSCVKSRQPSASPLRPATVPRIFPGTTTRSGGVKLIAVGSSTGGVAALKTLLDGLPVNLPPIAVTQHMPDEFIARFATRLDSQLGFKVGVAEDGQELKNGHVYIAPGHKHLEVVTRQNQLFSRLTASPPVSGHRPSVDVLFGSVANAVGQFAVGVILTGMGRDGAVGLRSMRSSGALCLGQDKASCVVYGMPRAAYEIGAVEEELNLVKIPDRICRFINEFTLSPSPRKLESRDA